MGAAVVTGGDASPVFEPAPEALDEISFAVSDRIVRDLADTRGTRRNDGFSATLRDELANEVGVIAAISDEAPEWPQRGNERGSGCYI